MLQDKFINLEFSNIPAERKRKAIFRWTGRKISPDPEIDPDPGGPTVFPEKLTDGTMLRSSTKQGSPET